MRLGVHFGHLVPLQTPYILIYDGRPKFSNSELPKMAILICVCLSSPDISSVKVKAGGRGKAFDEMEKTVDEKTSLRFRWKVDLLKCIDATPTVIESSPLSANVYVGSHSGLFVCVDMASGDEIWREKFPDRIEASAAVSNCGHYIFVGKSTSSH